MWDNPRLMNAVSNALFAFAALLVAGFALRAVVNSSAFPLRSLTVLAAGSDAAPRHVGYAQAARALEGRIAGTFFSVDLVGLRVLFETIPWVRRAEVRRRWPDRLEVRIEEHRPLARWGLESEARGEGRLVNVQGELFSVPAADLAGEPGLAALPRFAGPAGSEREVARAWGEFRALLAPIELEPREVSLSPRYAWQLRLSNGLAVQIGRDGERESAGERLARFVSAYPQTLARLARRLEYVDLRYPNGFALRVPGIEKLDAPKSGAPSAPAPAGAAEPART